MVKAGESTDLRAHNFRHKNGYCNSKLPRLTRLPSFPLVAVLRGDSNVTGTVTFTQESESSPTIIEYNLKGNDPNAQRGLHIHQFGDNTNGCTSAGPHFNPFERNHGAPDDEERHVGDLGNVSTDAEGNAVGTREDRLIKLIGPESVLGVSTFFQLV